MPNVLRIPISNIHVGSAYSAPLTIGSQGAAANVILDTGSSTLVVERSAYDGAGDAALKSTSLAQLITYAVGGWAGPVVTTDLSLGPPGGAVALQQVSIAIATVLNAGDIGTANGILGLAYRGSNPAFDLAAYFAKAGQPRSTYPWPFGTPPWEQFLSDFKTLTNAHALPQTEVAPCFDQLTAGGVIADTFAFYTLRSSVSRRLGADPAALAADPLNHGVFVLGGGEDEADLFQGGFVTAAVVHDLYYNVDLTSVRVEGCAAVKAARLQPKFRASLASNAIVDSGAEWLALAPDVHQAVLDGLASLNPAFAKAVRDAQKGQGAPTAALDLAAWPNLHFTLSSPAGEDVELTVAPQTYWQTDFPAAGQATFKIMGPLTDANQSNLGLPLLNNYYTVFDRSQGAGGVIRFAPIKPPAP